MNSPLSYIALIFSAAAFVFSVFAWRDRKRQEKRDLFLQLHERGHDVELQRGRRILYRVCSVEDARDLFNQKPEDYDCANKALWMLDITALYAEQGYIDREIFMQEWGFVYASIRPPVTGGDDDLAQGCGPGPVCEADHSRPPVPGRRAAPLLA